MTSSPGSRGVGDYDADFYRKQRDGSRTSAAAIVPRLIEWFRPHSVVDVGCGVGTWLAEFRRLGVEDILGIDGDYVERSMLEIPADRFVPKDLDGALGLSRLYDVVLSLEVAEHLPAASADAFVASLTSLGPIVVFSAAIPGQGGNGHVNEAWPEVWARRFAARGYRWADPLRTLFWNDRHVEPWYAQNLLVFHRPDAFETPPWGGAGIGGSEWPLPLVHPKFFVRLADRRPTVRRAWRDFRRAIRAGFSGGAGG